MRAPSWRWDETLPDGTAAGEEQVMRQAGFAGPTRIEAGGGDVVGRSAADPPSQCIRALI
jgi:hypothetical protein